MNRRYNLVKLKPVWTVCLLFLITGCKKFLDQKPQNSITRDAFFKTKSDALAAIAGAYDGLQACSEKFLTWGEFRADLVAAINNNDITYPYYQYLDNTRPASDWSPVYRLISRANIVIEAVPGIPAIDPRFSTEESKAIIGEALFLRALGYFYLVRTFGEVPFQLTAPSSDNVTYILPKSPVDTILNRLEADLKGAETDVPASYVSDVDTRGRVTKGAVNALLTDIYLWRAKYSEAVSSAKKVIDNRSLYSLMDGSKWFSVFSQKNTAESIFETQYDYQLNENNNLKGYLGNFRISNLLYDYYTNDGDAIRGNNRTFRASASNQFWKYQGLNTENIERPTNDPNFIVYRLPEVLLMCAEALIHMGTSRQTEAVDLINKVHTRAGLSEYDFSSGLPPVNVLMDIVLKERAMEFAGEGKRWFDLVRVATNDNNTDLLVNTVVQSRSVGERSQIRARIVDPRSWYMPIGQSELAANPKLVQNPYYK